MAPIRHSTMAARAVQRPLPHVFWNNLGRRIQEIGPPLGSAVFWGREAAWVQVQLCKESYKLVGGGGEETT